MRSMDRIKSILRRNILALVFFGIILFGVLSFVSSRNQEIERIKELETFADGSFALIENQYGNIANKTLIFEDEPKSYDEVISDLEQLQNEVDEIIQSIPKDGSTTTLYDETVSDLEDFLNDIFITLEVEINRYSQEKELLPQKENFFVYKDGSIDANNSKEALDVLNDIALHQQWYFQTDQEKYESFVSRNNKLIEDIEELNQSPNSDPAKVKELYEDTGFFVYTKLFRISQKGDLQNNDYFENLDSLYENLNYLKSQYSIE